MTTIKATISRTFNLLGFSLKRLPKVPEDTDGSMYTDLFSADAIEKRRFYNLGAGAFSHRYWTNVDHPSSHYESAQSHGGIQLPWDAMGRDPLGVDSDSAELMYSSHVI